MAYKRKLEFATLEDGLQEAERLLRAGYQSAGNWDLAQCCGHLDLWLSYPMDGFPKPGVFVGSMLWIMKKTVGPRQLRAIIRDGFKSGLPTMPATCPAKNAASDAEALDALSQTVRRFVAYQDPIHPSPLFGPMDKSTATNLQLRHFEHHLGFLVSGRKHRLLEHNIKKSGGINRRADLAGSAGTNVP